MFNFISKIKKLISKLGSSGETSIVQTLLVAALIVAAFFIGMLWTKVQNYEKDGSGGGYNVGTGADTGDAPSAYAPTAPTKIELDPVSAKDYVRGNRKAKVALVEYSDLECPFCKSFHPTAQKLVSEYGDKIMWVYRHFPLDQLHSKARSEAASAECANILGGQDKFWAFIDKVYEVTPANNGLSADQLPTIAGQIGLNVDKFKECQSSKQAMAEVDADYESGIKAGVNGTPGNILLNTQTGETVQLGGAVPYTELKAKVDAMLSSAK